MPVDGLAGTIGRMGWLTGRLVGMYIIHVGEFVGQKVRVG